MKVYKGHMMYNLDCDDNVMFGVGILEIVNA